MTTTQEAKPAALLSDRELGERSLAIARVLGALSGRAPDDHPWTKAAADWIGRESELLAYGASLCEEQVRRGLPPRFGKIIADHQADFGLVDPR